MSDKRDDKGERLFMTRDLPGQSSPGAPPPSSPSGDYRGFLDEFAEVEAGTRDGIGLSKDGQFAIGRITGGGVRILPTRRTSGPPTRTAPYITFGSPIAVDFYFGAVGLANFLRILAPQLDTDGGTNISGLVTGMGTMSQADQTRVADALKGLADKRVLLVRERTVDPKPGQSPTGVVHVTVLKPKAGATEVDFTGMVRKLVDSGRRMPDRVDVGELLDLDMAAGEVPYNLDASDDD